MRFDKPCSPERSGMITSQEALERMDRLVRRMAALSIQSPGTIHGMIYGESDLIHATISDYLEAKEITILLTDPDMIEAREVVCEYHHDKHPESPWHIDQAALVRSGRNDNMLDVQAAYHGIKRGRDLERAMYEKCGLNGVNNQSWPCYQRTDEMYKS